MSQIVSTPHGELELPDEFSPEQVQAAVQKALPQMAAASGENVKANQLLSPKNDTPGISPNVPEPYRSMMAGMNPIGVTGTKPLTTPISDQLGVGNPFEAVNQYAPLNYMGQTGQGVQKGISNLENSMFGSPLGAGLTVAGASVPNLVQKGLGALYAALAVKNTPELARQAGTTSVTGTEKDKAQAMTELVGNIIGGGLAGGAVASSPRVPTAAEWLAKELDKVKEPQGRTSFETKQQGQQWWDGKGTRDGSAVKEKPANVTKEETVVPKQIQDVQPKVAPVVFRGVQPGFGPIPEMKLYNLTEDVEGLGVKGSTLAERTIKDKGYSIPDDGASPAAATQSKPNNPTQPPQQGGIGGGINKAIDKNKEGGSIPLSIFKDLLGREKEKRGDYTLDAPMVLMDSAVSGFASKAQPAAEQLTGRLENLAKQGKVSKDELEVYKEQGLDEFLKTKPSVTAVANWMQENGPRVEVTKFGEGAEKLEPEHQEFKHMTHEWLDSQPEKNKISYLLKTKKSLAIANENANAISNADTNEISSADAYAIAYAYAYADANANADVSADADGYSKRLLAAKTSQEIHVVKQQISNEILEKEQETRAKYIAKLGDKAKRYFELHDKYVDVRDKSRAHWSFVAPKAEKDMPGYVEVAVTKPLKPNFNASINSKEFSTGEKFPSSHEFPPNTLGFGRGYMETLPNGKKVFHVVEVQSDWAQSMRERSGNYIAQSNDGLGRWGEYQKDGSLVNSFPTKEAAQISLNKHLSINDPLLPHHESLVLKALIDHARSQGADAIAISDAETAMMSEGHDAHAIDRLRSDVQAGEKTHEITDPLKNSKDYVRVVNEEPGMRLHYDQILPSIVEKLTGQKGERVEMGEHKNAFEHSGNTEESELIPNEKVQRSDLIFKNPDGTPKTSVTARMYSIPKKGELPFSLFGKTTPKVTVGDDAPAKGIGAGIQKAIDKNSKSEFGSIVNPAKVAQEIVEKTKNHWLTRPIRDAISYAKDAADNFAGMFATREVNTLRNEMERVYGKQAKDAEQALTFVVEADGDKAKLQEFRNKIQSSGQLSSSDKARITKHIDMAEKQWTQLSATAAKYNKVTKAELDKENAASFETPYRSGYVFHAQDVDNTLGFFKGSSGETPSSFKKMRVYPTYADSLAAGVDAKSLNALDLLHKRLQTGSRMVNNKAWVDSFRGVQDPVTKLPLIQNLSIVKRPDGSTYIDVPHGYSQEYIGGQTVAVHNGYEGLFSALTDPSWFEKNPVRRAFRDFNTNAKSITLLFDTFHLARVALWESLIKGAGLTTMQVPIPSYGKGLALLDHTVPELQKMLTNKEIPDSYSKDLLQNKKDIDLLISKGYNIGQVTDALHQELVQSAPLVGTYNKFLFEKFQRGAMTEIGLLELKRYRGMYKDLPDAEIARKVALDLNKRFGNLGRQGWFKSRTGQDFARVVALAPQWNEGLIKTELGALQQAFETVKDAATRKRIAAGVLLRSVGGMIAAMFVANQIINQYTRKQFTWQNKEEGIGAKLSAWIPSIDGKGKGFFLHPMGLAAETTHLLLNAYEKTGNLNETVMSYLRSRESQVMKPILTLISGQDDTGKHLKRDDATIASTMAKELIPKPIPTKTISALAGKQDYPGQIQRQLMASAGIKTDSVPSASSQIGRLAKAFNTKKGVSQNAEFYGGDYDKLIAALNMDDTEAARKEYEMLVAKKGYEQLSKYFTAYPNKKYTGNAQREQEFKNTLTENQLYLYKQAQQERRNVSAKYFKMLHQPKAKGFQE